MRIVYCVKCNNFMCSNRIENYCRECKSPVRIVPMTFSEYSSLSINERYRLAYRLTHNYEQTVNEMKK